MPRWLLLQHPACTLSQSDRGVRRACARMTEKSKSSLQARHSSVSHDVMKRTLCYLCNRPSQLRHQIHHGTETLRLESCRSIFKLCCIIVHINCIWSLTQANPAKHDPPPHAINGKNKERFFPPSQSTNPRDWTGSSAGMNSRPGHLTLPWMRYARNKKKRFDVQENVSGLFACRGSLLCLLYPTPAVHVPSSPQLQSRTLKPRSMRSQKTIEHSLASPVSQRS